MKVRYKMEQFLTTFGQHISSLLNLKAMKWIDTGDRMMDTTLQMMTSTLTAALITLCLAMYKHRGLVGDIRRWIKIKLGKESYNPLEFDPSLANGKPGNGKKFLYECIVNGGSFTSIGLAWFLKHHSSKFYVFEKQENSLTTKIFSSYTLEEFRYFNTTFVFSKEVYVPVWKDLNGYWVYMISPSGDSINGIFGLVSDSYAAIENCYNSIHEMNTTILTKTKEVETNKKKERNLYELQGAGNALSSAGTIPMNKTFDNLFFEQKNDILPLLKSFKEKTLFPAHLPLDNKLGIILHGSPGTGKTGFISALANYLDRDIALIDMNKVTTQAALNDLLTPTRSRNYIFVFEEIDCMPCITKRSDELQKRGDVTNTSHDLMMMAMGTKDTAVMEQYKKDKADAKDKIDLGYLLRKLDGLESAEGRIIVATTNHPERIDPALLRPGRFGIQLHMKKANQEVLRQILEMVYQTPVSEDDVYEVDDYKWSPAEILQKSMMYKNVPDVLTVLRNENPDLAF